ncbi:TonB-dependent receptor [bacterium]|nr:TonB-dependent receptor [bacterium]
MTGFANNAYSLVTVSGKVRDKKTGESIPGVSVWVKGSTRGASANVEGFFSIPDLEPEPIKLVFTAMGYERFEQPLDLVEGDHLNMAIYLKPTVLKMEAVVVEAETEELKYTPQVAHVEIETRELAALPQLAEPDLFRSLQILPGVLSSSDFSSELNIWGGSSDQNLILLNGIEVYKPTHLGGIFSVFNMDAVKDVKLIKGGFGAEYGGRLSAVVDVADREGNRNDFQGKLGLSLLSSNAIFEGPFPRGSWLVAGRRTYVDAATKLLKNSGVIDDELPYYFYDFNAKVTRDFANGDRLSPSVYTGRDILKLSSSTDDQIRMNWGNTTYSLPFIHIFSHKLYSQTTLAGSFFDSRHRFDSGDLFFAFENEVQDLTLKSDLTFFATPRHTFLFGAMAKLLRTDLGIYTDTQVITDDHDEGTLFATYLADNIRLTPSIAITPGVRLEHFTLSELTEVMPRFGIRKDLSDYSHLSAAWGMYTQYLQLVRFGDGFASIFDSWVPLDDTFQPNRGQQFALTYKNEEFGPFELTTDIYYKRFDNIIEFDMNTTDDADTELKDMFREGDGYAFGWDLLLQGDWKSYDFMIGYGLGNSRRSFDAYDNGLVYPAPFDRLHNTNLFVSRKVRKRGSLEVRFNYGTGQPITAPVGFYSPGLDLPPQFFVPGRRNNFRIPNYYRLDIAYRLRYEYSKWTFSPFIEILNVTNHKNVLTMDYDLSWNPPMREEVDQLPILPTIGFTAEF